MISLNKMMKDSTNSLNIYNHMVGHVIEKYESLLESHSLLSENNANLTYELFNK